MPLFLIMLRFIHEDEAGDAFDAIDGKKFEGRELSLEWARESGGEARRERRARSRSRSRSR